MKVMLGQGSDDFVVELSAKFPEVTFVIGGTVEEQIEQIADADVYFGWPAREAFVAGEQLRWVQNPGTGIDRIMQDLPELVDSDVVLTNSRGPHAPPMADHVMGMVLSLAHRMGELWEDQQAHRWEPGPYNDTYVELAGSTIGILSLGDIGMAVARRAHGFGMEVYAVDKHPRPTGPEVTSVWGLERLDKLLSMSDWFVVTAPLTDETRGFIGRSALKRMKPNAILINTSRGAVVDIDALCDAVERGSLAGAALDVLPEEPPGDDARILGLGDKVILCPHMVSANAPGTLEPAIPWATDAILAALRGEIPEHVYNVDVIPRWLERFGGKALI